MQLSTASELKGLARLLLACENAQGDAARPGGPAAFGVCEKLRGPLSKNLGPGGLFALMGRALALAGRESPWLRSLQIKADRSVEGLDPLAPKLDMRAIAEGEVAFVAQLLGLLVTFIGAALTVRFLHDIWPELDV